MKTYLLFLVLTFSYASYAGGPWLNKKKSGFFQVQSTFPSGGYSSLFLENNQEAILNRPVLDYTFQAYLEYGITDKLDFISTLPYKYVSTGSLIGNDLDSLTLKEGTLSGLSNYKLGFKYQLIDKKIKMAVSIHSSLNTIRKDVTKGLTTGYNSNTYGIRTHIGRSFSANIYSFIDLGVNKMTNDFSDFIDIHYELGYQIKPSLWTAFTLDLRESLKNGTYSNPYLKQTGLYTNDQEYFAFGLKASYELKTKIGFTAASFGAFSGNYVAKISTFSLGVYKKW